MVCVWNPQTRLLINVQHINPLAVHRVMTYMRLLWVSYGPVSVGKMKQT